GPAKARFVDNGDGTVTDNQTGLMWEKKTAAQVNDFYIWSSTSNGPDGELFFIFLATMTCAGSRDGTCGLAGHIDWRIPNIAELRSIVDCTKPNCLDPVFGPLPNGSLFWSSSAWTDQYNPDPCCAWAIDTNGNPVIRFRWDPLSARAVRGGR